VPEDRPPFGGQGRDPLALVDLLRYAGRLYGAHVATLVPAFVAAFIGLRELLLVLLPVAQSTLALLLVAALVQAVIPAFVGSLLVAAAIPVLWGEAGALREAWGALAGPRGDIYRAARWSAGLALFFTITLGSVGVIIQPMVFGPPLLIHEIVLQRHRLDRAWERARRMMERDSRQLVYLLAIPAAIGLLVAAMLRAFGVLSGDIPGVLRGVLYFAVQGALLGAAIPLVAAVGVLLYADMASTLGGDETT
jgi:hypothetical protein